MFVIGFNGPPGSGKDTLAQMVAEHMTQQGVTIPVVVEHLSYPLRVLAYSMVGLDYAQEHKQLPYADFKTTWFEQFQRTGRELMIDVSERFLKRCYGPEIMANMLLVRIQRVPDHSVILVADCGFQVEIAPILHAVGASNLAVAKLMRPKFESFEGDSREWVRHPNSKLDLMVPNRSLDDLRTEAGRLYDRLVNQKGWVL